MHLLLRLLFPALTPPTAPSLLFRLLVLATVTVFAWPYFTVRLLELGFNPGWFHHVHLVFHEAGHALTAMVTSHEVTIAFMGSGLQVLFPLFVALSFYAFNRDAFSAGLGLTWAGHAALDVAPYIADARVLNLDLLTGGTGKEVGGHDWLFLLQAWNALDQDLAIARQVARYGQLAMGLGLLWAAAALLHGWALLRSQKVPAPSSPDPAG